MKRVRIAALAWVLAGGVLPSTATGQVITGQITNWVESGPVLLIGDGVNGVHIWWSINTFNRGWFYGSAISGSGNSSVAHAVGITDVHQIADAGVFAFTPNVVGPLCDAVCDPDHVGEFVVWRNNTTGYYGVLRIDSITGSRAHASYLNGTWWFQRDGTGDFRDIPVAVEPVSWSQTKMLYR